MADKSKSQELIFAFVFLFLLHLSPNLFPVFLKETHQSISDSALEDAGRVEDPTSIIEDHARTPEGFAALSL
ncbi:MAG: hypothetical protein IKW83_07430 [Muribaculaceae bacterium]|nr:hypothetical protein [Muribaculaceae bacterium]